MMLRCKRLFFFLIIFVVQGSTIGQGFQFAFLDGGNEVYAQESVAKTDIVTIFVSKNVYSGIKGQLDWYTNTYIPAMAPGTSAVVMEIDPAGFDASDLQQILENLYFDGMQSTPSQLVGVMMFGVLPWPIVELEGRRFVSLYPYLDFIDPMFLFDPVEDVFKFNGNIDSLPELWHSTVPIDDVGIINKFFQKLQEYFDDPEEYAEKKIWYDDFAFLKQSFSEEELQRYVNTLLFAEPHSYRHVNPNFARLLSSDYESLLADQLDDADEKLEQFRQESVTHDSVLGNEQTEAAAEEILGGMETMLSMLDQDIIRENMVEMGEFPTPTKPLERLMLADFQPNYQVFGNNYLDTMIENISAGGRYIPELIDTSLEKIEIKDRVGKQFIKDMNEFMADALEETILERDYQLKFPLPFRLSVWEAFLPGGRFNLYGEVPYDPGAIEAFFSRFTQDEIIEIFGGKTFQQGPFMGLRVTPLGQFDTSNIRNQSGRGGFERARYELFYFGKNAVDITNYKDLTIFRGTPFNETSVERLRARPYEPTAQVEDIPGWDFNEGSVGMSMGRFAQQTQNNKAFNFDRALNERLVQWFNDYRFSDKELYDELKWDDEMGLDVFSQAFWGGASPFNVSINPNNPRDISMVPIPIPSALSSGSVALANFSFNEDVLSDTLRYDDFSNSWLRFGRNPSVAKGIGAPWYDPAGAVLTELTSNSKPDVEPWYSVDDNLFTAHSTYGRALLLRAESREGSFGRGLGEGIRNVFSQAVSIVNQIVGNEPEEDFFEEYAAELDYLQYDHPMAAAINYKLDAEDYDKRIDQRPILNDFPSRRSYEEMDYFFVYDNLQPSDFMNTTWLGITVQTTLGHDMDQDTDGIPDMFDPDRDGDGVPNNIDPDQGGNRIPNELDLDIDGDGVMNRLDLDIDGDGNPNWTDGDMSGNGVMNEADLDVDSDGVINEEDDNAFGSHFPLDEEGNPPEIVDAPNPEDRANMCSSDAFTGEEQGGEDSGLCIFQVECGLFDQATCGQAGAYCNRNEESTFCEHSVECTTLNKSECSQFANEGCVWKDIAIMTVDCSNYDIACMNLLGGGIFANRDSQILTEISCTDGVDNDGDGFVDCEDEDCSEHPECEGVDQLGSVAGGGVTGLFPGAHAQGGTAGGGTAGGEETGSAATTTTGGGNIVLGAREDRGTVNSIRWGRDYRYQIIDTMVAHRSPFDRETDLETTIMTLERPIDDGRFVSFHGIGGELVKMYYPNLYNVPIYDCNLLVPEDIQATITEYLQQKAMYFNELLAEQIDKAPDHYATHPAAFDFLAVVDRAATPNRSYELLDNNFFVDIVGQKNIERIAQHLHYLSTGRERRPEAETIGEFIEISREEFDINKRLEYIHQEYLTYDEPEDDFKFDPIAFPTHIEKEKTYEIGFINSDGFDTIERKVDDDEQEVSLPEGIPAQSNAGNMGSEYALEAAQYSNAINQACGFQGFGEIFKDIPGAQGVGGNTEAIAVPILKRPSAFQCWLEKTLENPFSFDLYIGVSGSDFLGQAFDERFTNRANIVSTPPEELTQQSLGSPLFGAAYAQNNQQNTAGSINFFSAEQQNKVTRSQLTPIQNNRFDQLMYESVILGENLYFSAGDTQGTVTINARSEIGRVALSISSDGELCPLVGGQNLCFNDYESVFNPYTNSLELPVLVDESQSGIGRIVVELCDISDNTICYKDHLQLVRGPGELAELVVTIPDETVPSQLAMPVAVTGLDSNSQQVFYPGILYELTIEGGSFSESRIVQSTVLGDLYNSYFMVYPLDPNNEEPVTLTLQANDEEYRDMFPSVSQTINRKIVGLNVTDIQQNSIDAIDYRLPHKDIGFETIDETGIPQLNQDILPSFQVFVNDQEGELLKAPVSLSTASGIVRVGFIGEMPYNFGNGTYGQRFLANVSEFVTSDSEPTSVYIQPVGITGTDTIYITLPGSETIEIPVTIKASGSDNMDISLSLDGLGVGDVFLGTVTITDSWGNLYTEIADVELAPWGSLSIDNTSFEMEGGVVNFTGMVVSEGAGGCGGKCSGKNTSSQQPVDDVEQPEPDKDDVDQIDPERWDDWQVAGGGGAGVLQGSTCSRGDGGCGPGGEGSDSDGGGGGGGGGGGEQPAEEENLGIELECTDGIDNDQDGFTDCDDFDCADHPACEGIQPKGGASAACGPSGCGSQEGGGGAAGGSGEQANSNNQGPSQGSNQSGTDGTDGSTGPTGSGEGSGEGGDTPGGSGEEAVDTAGETVGDGSTPGGESDEGGSDSDSSEGSEGTDSGSEDAGDDGSEDMCGSAPELSQGPPDSWYGDEGATYGEAQGVIGKELWPSEKDDDINIMYLNLMGHSWGNLRRTTEYLGNSKTLSITTHHDLGGDKASRDIVAAMIFPDGYVNDKKNIVKQLAAEGGDIVFYLGYNGGIGKISMGSHVIFDFIQEGEEFTNKPNKLVYSPNEPDSVTDESSFSNGRITHNGIVVADFIRGFIDQDLFIRLPEGGGDTWIVTYKNKKIGSLRFYRGKPELIKDVRLIRSDYRVDMMPGGNSNLSPRVVTILLDAEDASGGGTVFESIEAAINPKNLVGFRHEFASLTNFAQGSSVGNATKHFGGLFLMNIGDPFLKRIDDNQFIKETDFDGGVGQTIFSDTKSIADVDLMDFDNDGRKDMVITHRDGSLRLLKNYGGENPYKDLGDLIVVADGIRETYIGDINGNGWDDILLLTESQQLRAYMNDQGRIDVDGRVICLDIPNGEFNVAQVRQLYATNLEGSTLDIVTLDVNGDLKVFYGGGGATPNYVSTDRFSCDDGRRDRLNQQHLKSFGATISGSPVQDYSMRSWGGLQPYEQVDLDLEVLVSGDREFSEGDVEDMSKDELKEMSQNLMNDLIDELKSYASPEKLFESAVDHIDFVTELPNNLLPDHLKEGEPVYGIAAKDLYPDAPRYDVQKTFLDLNGGTLQKGDMVQVTVNLISLGVSDYVYWEKLEGPWIIYRDEFGNIPSFDRGTLGGNTVDRNIGNGYEFMVYGDIGGGKTFSYVVQYNGDGYVHMDIETNEEGLYKGPTNQSVAGLAPGVNAQGGRNKTIRVYADDGCYKKFREFSPGEQEVNLQDFLDEKLEEYEDEYFDNRDQTQEVVENVTDLGPMEEMLGIPSTLDNDYLKGRGANQIGAMLRGGTTVELDATAYNDWFVENTAKIIEEIHKIPLYTWEKGTELLGFDSLGLFEDYSFSTNRCGGTTLGSKKSCGFGLPIPFNNDLLSPGHFHVFGCAPRQPNIPSFFPKFDGIPIFAFPTNVSVLPVWPPSFPGAGGIPPFKGSTSQIRMYATMTTTGGVGFSLCFGPYGTMDFLPTPLSDVMGNCLVIASNARSPCYGEEGEHPITPVRATILDPKEAESTDILDQEYMDLYRTGVCDMAAQQASPIRSTLLGGNVSVPGTPKSVQMNQLTHGHTYMRGGEAFDLKIEGGTAKGFVQCMLRNWTEKQTAYFANNALNMQIDIVLPTLDRIVEGLGSIRNINERTTYGLGYINHDDAMNRTSEVGSASLERDEEEPHETRPLPRSIVSTIESDLNNPFEYVMAYFENVPLVNFDERDVAIQLPILYKEDLVRYKFTLNARLERNGKIIDAWKEQDLVTTDFMERMEQAVRLVESNLRVIDEYAELPNKIYEMLHMNDQYITEVIRFVNRFTGQITGWLQVNANKFSAWVDFIITLKGIIETWQLIIEFMTNWESKCAKCRQDNFDFYSCKLKLLCIDLPVLPIPPFHIPNILIDLSKIDIGIDIIIPQFRFIPTKMTLPVLPDLPTPRAAEIEVIIPLIPRLPRPPRIPELPRLEMDIDIRLPTLPPAPKVPKLSPVIEGVITVADVIGTFMCIFKGGIGLVAEEGIKARVEQLTQRRNDILPFDELRLELPQAPIRGWDYKIDSYVDLKADFRHIYDIVDGIVMDRNSTVQNKVNDVRKSIGNVYDNDIGRIIRDQPLDTNVIIDLQNTSGYNETLLAASYDIVEESLEQNNPIVPASLLEQYDGFDDYASSLLSKNREDFFVGGEVSVVKQSLSDGLNYLLARNDLSQYHKQANEINALLNRKPLISPHYEGLEAANYEMAEYLEGHLKKTQETKEMIRDDYDRFLDELVVFDLVADTTALRSFSSPLYETDAGTKSMIANQEHPFKTYLTMNQGIVNGYVNALRDNSPFDLNMSQVRYDETRSYMETLSSNIDQILTDGFNPEPDPQVSSTPATQLVQSGGGIGGGGSSSAVDPKFDVDITQYLQGFFVPGEDGNYHNVITLKSTGNRWYRSEKYIIDDLNGDGTNDIINFTDRQIIVKYGQQNASFGGGIGGSYTIGPYATIEDLIDAVRPTAGRDSSGGATFKIWDDFTNVYTFSRSGQSFETVAFSWEQEPHLAGYILEVAERPDTLREKNRGSHREGDLDRTRYILALPSSASYENVALEIYDQLPQRAVDHYIDSGVIADVIYYDPKQPSVHSLLVDFERRWHYLRISPLRLEKYAPSTGRFGNLFRRQQPEYVYRKIGPRSQQRVAGTQNAADTQRPTVTVELIRNLTGETVSQGQQLVGYINTDYTMKGVWDDNGEVLRNRIVYDGEVIQLESGEEIELTGLDFKYPIEEQFLFYGIDQAGNIGEQLVTLTINVPDLVINEIRYLGSGAEIETKMSQTIDRGLIKFEGNRFGFWKPLQPALFSVKPTDPIVVGGLYPFDNGIVIQDSEGNELGAIDTETGEITLNDGAGTGAGGSAGGVGAGGAGGAGAGGGAGGAGGVGSGGGAGGGGSGAGGGGFGDSGAGAGSQDGGGEGAGGGAVDPQGEEGGEDFVAEMLGVYDGVFTSVDFVENGRPHIHIWGYNTETEEYYVIFSVRYSAERLAESDPLRLYNAGWRLYSLQHGDEGDFNQGRCMGPMHDECHVYITEEGDIFLPEPYRYQYIGDYSFENGIIGITITTLDGTPQASVHFTAKAFR